MSEILEFAAKDGWHMFVTLSVLCLPLLIGGLVITQIVSAITGNWEPQRKDTDA